MMSFVIICDLIALTLAVCSRIFSSISANWSYSGWITSSVIFYSSFSFCVQDWLSLRQCSNSLFMESRSSVTNSMLRPSGLVL